MKILLSFLVLISSLTIKAQDNLTLNSVRDVLVQNQGQIVSLAEEFSEDQFEWSPAEGVRSVGASLLHVAGANYFLIMKLGFEVPADVDMMGISNIKGKANIIEAVRKSNEFVQKSIVTIDASTLSDKVDMPFGEFTTLSTVLLVLEHSGEHKGQLIAYARSNDIVPPWSK